MLESAIGSCPLCHKILDEIRAATLEHDHEKASPGGGTAACAADAKGKLDC
jgi:hypothetical protein